MHPSGEGKGFCPRALALATVATALGRGSSWGVWYPKAPSRIAREGFLTEGASSPTHRLPFGPTEALHEPPVLYWAEDGGFCSMGKHTAHRSVHRQGWGTTCAALRLVQRALEGGGSTPEKRDSTPLAGPGPPLSPPCPPATPTKGYTWHSPGLSQSPQGTPQEDDHDEVTPSSTEGGDRHASLTVWNPPRELLTGHTTVAGTRGARWERE